MAARERDAIYGTSRSPFPYLSWGVATRKGGTLYLHVFQWPKNGELKVPLSNPAKAATLLATGQKLALKRTERRLAIGVPATAPDPADSVIALEVEGEPVTPALPSAGAKAVASAQMAGSEAANAFDGTGQKRWRAPASVKSAWLEVDLGLPFTIGAFGLDEPDVWPRMKQQFKLEAWRDDAWRQIAEGETDGHGQRSALTPVTAQKFRLSMACEQGSPGVAELQLYRAD